MKKSKIIKPFLIVLLMLFSFYYTNKSVDIIKNNDPLMKQIKSTNKEYKEESVNVKIKDNKIIPGKVGKQIDLDKTYNNMKRYGKYSEVLTVLKEVKPENSIDDIYDKFIISGNEEKKSVAFVFKINKYLNINNYLKILNEYNIPATFFLDGVYIERHLSEIDKLKKFELELLSYNNEYNKLTFANSLTYLKTITGKKPKYCYAEYDNEKIIKLCQKLKLHTIIPTIKVDKQIYKEVKNKITNASIINIPIDDNLIEEFIVTIDYLKSKGYTFKTLENLLSESIDK